MEHPVHRRLIANSQALFDELNKLGFKEVDSGNNKIKKFKKGKKFITTYYGGLVLYEMGNTEKFQGKTLSEKMNSKKIYYEGLTVHDELLIFFSKRTLT